VSSPPPHLTTVTSESTATPEPTVTSESTATPEPPEPTATTDPTAIPETLTPTPEPDPSPEAGTPVPTVTVTPAPEKQQLPPSGYTGDVLAIRTEGGYVVPVRSANSGTYEVVTPCYNVATLSDGLEITGPIDVLIDPGHGGPETGAVGPNGLKESTVNLRVAGLLRQKLIDRGYTAELTRYSDHRLAIQSRTELANALAPRVFLSIHHNGGFPEPLPEIGTEMFVQLGDPESARLGGLLFEEILDAFADTDIDWMGNEETRGVAWRQNQEGTDLYGILRRTPGLVTVLTEAMFLSTAGEADLLAQPEILEIEAEALAVGLERFFETEDPGSGFIDGIVFQGDLGNGGGTFGCEDPTNW